MTASPLVLASGSPRRRELLARAGYRPRVVIPRVDETPPPGTSVRDAIRFAAARKAQAVASRFPDAWVLAADTLIVDGAKALGKPANRGEAVEMLMSLSGRSHLCVSAVVLTHATAAVRREVLVESEVCFKRLTRADVDAYLDGVDVLDKAGAYAIQEAPDLLGAEVVGSRSNVIGLPMEAVLELFQELGIRPGTSTDRTT